MKRFRQFLMNAAVLTAVTLVLRSVAVLFNAYVSGKIGAEGMGLYALVLSVYGLFSTFAISGGSFAAARMTAEALGRSSDAELRGAMKRCLGYGAAFGLSASAVMYAGAAAVGEYLLEDIRSVGALRILAPSLLPMALVSTMHGYFQAVRRVAKSAAVMLLEQWSRIAVTVAALSMFLPFGMSYACIAVGLGVTASEIVAFTVAVVLYRRDLKKYVSPSGFPPSGLTTRMLGIAFPMALSAYARSGLLTLEHMLIPRGLRRYGAGGAAALATYGVLHGMAMPVVLYPLSLLQAFTGLLLPELAEAKARGDERMIRRTAARVCRVTLLFSIGTAGIMLAFSEEFGSVLYGNTDAGRFIAVMSPLIPVMYLDSAVDAMLKGLGEQIYCMKVNIADSLLSVLMVWVLLPKYGVMGYVVTIYVCEILNASLSVGRLLYIAAVRVHPWKWLILPVISVTAAAAATRAFASLPALALLPPLLPLIMGCIAAVLVYYSMLLLTRSLGGHELRDVIDRIRQ